MVSPELAARIDKKLEEMQYHTRDELAARMAASRFLKSYVIPRVENKIKDFDAELLNAGIRIRGNDISFTPMYAGEKRETIETAVVEAIEELFEHLKVRVSKEPESPGAVFVGVQDLLSAYYALAAKYCPERPEFAAPRAGFATRLEDQGGTSVATHGRQ